MSIHILSPEVSAQIAAGEVIERPASVVKELVENALDAGATQVTVEAAGGGVALIRVIDNGEGIEGEEVEKAFQRFATSKVQSAQDLEHIATLGFRGEALPSIAAVAEVAVVTRRPEELAGTFISLRGGAVVGKAKRGCPPGTAVTVRRLFHSVPARLKFLKSLATESGHISHLVGQFALAFPEVRFTLLLEGRTAFQSQGNGSLRDVLAQVYGPEVAQAMLEVRGEEGEVRAWGFVGPASLARASRGYLSFFVNRRPVQSRMLAYAVEEAYQGLLMTGRHPIAVLHLALPPQEVDVNVHPTKAEVRFRRERDLFAAVQKAVRRTLTEQAPIPTLRMEPRTPQGPPMAPRLALAGREGGGREPLSSPPPQAPPHLPILRVLGQVSGTYVIAEGPEGIYLIDQHAAHERVLFEKLQREQAQQRVEVQGLLEPLTLELLPPQEAALRERGQALAELGFALETFGPRAYLLRAVPALLKGQSPREALVETLEAPAEGSTRDFREAMAISLACRGALKAGQALSLPEMQELVRQLEETERPRTCPHGRPTMIHLSSSHLEKEFGRR